MKNLFILTFAVMMITACSSSSTQEATSTVDSTVTVTTVEATTVEATTVTTSVDSVSADTTK